MQIHKAFILISLIFFTSTVFAGKVIKTKENKVYILFDKDEPFTDGDFFVLNNDQGKKIGLVQIKKSKGLKAIGVLKKGKAKAGLNTTFKMAGKKIKKAAPTPSEETAESEDTSASDQGLKSRWGLMAGYGSASQEVNQASLGVSSQSGSSMAIRGVYDYAFFPSVYLRGGIGAEIFSVSGSGHPISAPSTVTDIGTDITYITFDALFYWTAVKMSSLNLYLVGGMGILYPMSKTSTAILEDSIASLAIGEFGAGVEIKTTNYTFPIDLCYYYFPSGADVTTSVISFKVGMLF